MPVYQSSNKPAVIITLSVIILIFIVAGCQQTDDNLINLDDSPWEYLWSNADYSTVSQDTAVWRPMKNFPGVPAGRNDSKWLWLRVRLPETLNNADTLWVRRSFLHYQVYSGQEMIGQYSFKSPEDLDHFDGFRWTMIQLPKNPDGQYVFFRFESSVYYIGPAYSILAGEKQELMEYIFRKDILVLSFNLLLLLAGSALFLISFLNSDLNNMRMFSLLLLLTALYTLRYLDVRFFYLDSALFWDYIGLFIMYGLPFAFVGMVKTLFYRKKSPALTISNIITLIFAVATLAVIIIIAAGGNLAKPPLSLILIIFQLRFFYQFHITATAVIVLFLLFKKQLNSNKDFKLFLLGIIIFLISAVPSLLAAAGLSVGLINYNTVIYIGVYVLLAVNAFILVRRYNTFYTEYKEIVYSHRHMASVSSGPGLHKAESELIKNSVFSFTARETEVIAECMLGKKNREIADDLGISERTVKTHFTHIFNKTDASNKLELLYILNCCSKQK